MRTRSIKKVEILSVTCERFFFGSAINKLGPSPHVSKCPETVLDGVLTLGLKRGLDNAIIIGWTLTGADIYDK